MSMLPEDPESTILKRLKKPEARRIIRNTGESDRIRHSQLEQRDGGIAVGPGNRALR